MRKVLDQMQAKIQFNPTAIVLCYKNLSNNYVSPTKNSFQVFEKSEFPPKFNGL